MIRELGVASVVVAALLAVPSCASTRVWRDGRQGTWGPAGDQRVAYENGYRRGFERGAMDARAGRQYEFRTSRDYRDAGWGYSARVGPRGEYRQLFRTGYERGYAEGYRGRGAAAGRGQYGYPGGAYPGSAPGAYPGGYGYRSAASEYGYQDGYEKGMEDLRKRNPYDPIRHKWYREGDRHYNSRYGPREEYKRVYREAFRAGYDAAFRGGRW